MIAWFESVEADELYVSVMTLGEMQQGIERLARRDARQAGVYEAWLRRLRRQCSDRLLAITEEIAVAWGRLNAGDPLPVVDGLLAATAIVHRPTLVTRNVTDVARIGVPLLDPFEWPHR